jgi:hypothetical protein
MNGNETWRRNLHKNGKNMAKGIEVDEEDGRKLHYL